MNIMHDQNAHWLPQKRVLRLWLASQRRSGSSNADNTEARLQELCASEGWNPDGSDGEEEEEEEMENSEPLDDSDVILSDSGKMCAGNSIRKALTSLYRGMLWLTLLFMWFVDDDLEGYDKMVSGRRKTGRVSDVRVVISSL